ncbi:MAG: hypothetical protein ACREKH_16950 [Candidatus Rokuibacteriota bacterium]
MTLTGNPQNMLVGSFLGISYRAFLAREAPIAVVGLVCVFAVIAPCTGASCRTRRWRSRPTRGWPCTIRSCSRRSTPPW